MARPVALVVDDEPDLRELLALTLERMDIEASTCADVASARDRLARREFQLCLTDMRLPDGDGIELIEWMQARGLKTPVAVITAHGNVETAVRALKAGEVSKVAPVDKLSVVLIAVFAVVFLRERLNPREWAGVGLVAAGVVVLALKR